MGPSRRRVRTFAPLLDDARWRIAPFGASRIQVLPERRIAHRASRIAFVAFVAFIAFIACIACSPRARRYPRRVSRPTLFWR
ncbi:hypothetical protein [Burkholderia ambifaria]|uniref:hypothetical protein n=1 Tax=Burkholderia ambifaria TaxID=152480 RepID=UPI001588C6E1|nr:hypothetical protein [Burkholderia ambifaria]